METKDKIIQLVVYTLQNKGSHNDEQDKRLIEDVVYTLQNKGSHNVVPAIAE